MYKELDTIILAHDIEDSSLKEGAVGTIVHIYGTGEAYEVEFIKQDGGTAGLLTLTTDDFHPVTSRLTQDFDFTVQASSFKKIFIQAIEPYKGTASIRVDTRNNESNSKTFMKPYLIA